MDKRGAIHAYNESEALFRAGRYAEALLLLDELVARYPQEQTIRTAHAQCLSRLRGGEVSTAIAGADIDARTDEGVSPVTAGAKQRKPVAQRSRKKLWWAAGGAGLTVAILVNVLSHLLVPPGLDEAAESSTFLVDRFLEDLPIEDSRPAEDEILDVPDLMAQLDNRERQVEAFGLLFRRAKATDAAELNGGFEGLQLSSGRWRAALILGKVGSETSIPVLTHALNEDGSLYVRRCAAYALGQIASDTATFDLTKALMEDLEGSVRERAAWALDQILGQGAGPMLERARNQEPDPNVRGTLEWLLDYSMKGTRLPPISNGRADFGVLKDTQYKVYVPSNYTPDRSWPLLVSVHGTAGRPTPYEEMWRGDAERYGFIVLAPYFDVANFPNYDLMELAGVRSDLRLLEIIASLESVLSLDTEKFYLYGHSKGGQFVSRFVLLHADRLIKAVASGAGHYANPDPANYFPSGLKPHPLMAPTERIFFDEALRLPFAVVIGTEDLGRRKKVALDFIKLMRECAEGRNINNWPDFIFVPDGEHLGATNQYYAADYFFNQ